MNALSFIRGAVVAFVLSLAASVIFFSASMFYLQEPSIQITTTLVSFVYILYLLSQTNVSFGKVSSITLYLLAATAVLVWSPSLLVFTLFHLTCIWLVRTVYHHTSFLMALADLSFTAIGFTAAIGAVLQTGSVFMSFWSFLLAQAMVLPIIRYLSAKLGTLPFSLSTHQHPCIDTGNNFQQAHNNAQSALAKLVQSN